MQKSQKSAPVIGKFMHYATDVRTYTFKNSLGRISHINATPNHPFYVKNKHGFVAIGNVSDDDTLVGGIGSGENHIDGAVHLVCVKGKHSHCGEAFMGNVLPVSVYNLEVYRRHVYRVGGGKIIVHNMCESDILKRLDTTKWVVSLKPEVPELSDFTRVRSTDTNSLFSGEYQNEFINRYKIDHWIMKYNFKEGPAKYYMSDVVYMQAKRVFGETIPMPKIITRFDISNEETARIIDQYKAIGNDSALMDAFMKKTVNGKSTQRILDTGQTHLNYSENNNDSRY